MAEYFEIRVGHGAVRFSAAHFLIFGPNHCEPIHGHDYRIDVVLRGPLSGPGWVADFHLVEDRVKKVIAPLEHRLLLPTLSRWLRVEYPRPECVGVTLGQKAWQFSRQDCCLLPLENTSAELLAAYLGRQMRESLPAEVLSGLQRLSVEVYETPHCSAIWIWQSDDTSSDI